jgi:hypothetical protein
MQKIDAGVQEMHRYVYSPLIGFTIVLCVFFAFVQAVSTQTMGVPEEFTAGAVDLNRGQTGTVEISVDRWSTSLERVALTNVLLAKGQEGLLNALQEMRPVGRIHTPDSIGYDLRYSQQRRGPDGGRDIVLATDRPISYWEAVNRPRSIDYPFTFIQIHMDADGTGEGKLSVAARITSDKSDQMIEIENYQLQPVSLVEIRSRVKTD